MVFVITQPEAIKYAAGILQSLSTSMAAQNAAAAAPTTDIIPAAADPVSALQAAQFDAYGRLYQSVSAQATAIHQMLVNNLGTGAGSYGTTEAANQTSTGSTSLTGLLNSLAGGSGAASASATPAAGSTAGTAGGAATFAINGVQNFTSAASDLISQASIGTLPGFGVPSAGGSTAGIGSPAGAPTTVPAGGVGATPVLAAASQATSLSGMSVPPGWVANTVPFAGSAPEAVAGAGWTSPPNAAPINAVPGGVPAVASAGRGGYGIGAPRYGVKPTVMPKPTVI